MRRAPLLLLGLLALACERRSEPAPNPAPRPAPKVVASSSVAVAYRVTAPRPRDHYVYVEARLPARGRDALTVMLPVWTPGSYLVREYARHVDRLEAFAPDGRALELEKVRKNRWRVSLDGAAQAILRYRVYAREASVRTNFVDDRYFVLNGAATFLTDVEALERPHELALALPEGFEDVAVDLPKTEDGRRVARDYEHLVDAPIVAGALRRLPFEVGGVPHELVQLGGEGLWNDARAAQDVQRITETLVDFWGVVPYERYLFLNVIGLGRGGLEHRGSTLMMADRFAARTEAAYRGWLSLVAHEHFHTWNGKRLRPVELGPFDYEREVYTEALWMVEGLTSYYDDLIVARAGLSSEAEYLEALSGQIERLEATPGRLEQPLARASYDAWIEFYRPDESSRNTTVSYYNKGAVVGFLIDAAIRRQTGGAKSLDDVMRGAYARFSGPKGYTREALYGVFEEVGGEAVGREVRRLVETTEELEYGPALEWFGLRFRPSPKPPREGASAAERREHLRKTSWLGLETAARGGRLFVERVVAASPAEQAGFQAEDELVALDGIRVTDDLSRRVQLYLPGDELEALVARRGRMTTLEVRLDTRPYPKRRLEPDPKANRRAARHRASWLAAP